MYAFNVQAIVDEKREKERRERWKEAALFFYGILVELLLRDGYMRVSE